MPRYCSVLGCKNNSRKDKYGFYCLPTAIDKNGRVLQDNVKRRELWLKALSRPDLPEEKLKAVRICSNHFISGKPASRGDENHPDYVPSRNMGYGEENSEVKSLVNKLVRGINNNKTNQNAESPSTPGDRQTPDLAATNATNVEKNSKQYVSKWNALFDRVCTQWISFKPKLDATVYPCYACRDMFGSRASFLDHVNRRGMLISYKCPSCPQHKEITFYNPCAFLLHTRHHYSHTLGEIDLENVTISIIPIGLAGFFKHPDIPMIYNVEEDNVGESKLLNTRFYTPSADSEGERFVLLKPLMLLFYQPEHTPSDWNRLILKQMSSNIPRCKFVCLNNSGNTVREEAEVIEPRCPECLYPTSKIAQHIIGLNKPLDETLSCSVCKYIASTKCSLKAHERVHIGQSPFVCPECGKEFDTQLNFMCHLEDVCYHLAKHIRFRCPARNCWKVFAASSTFTSHFQIHCQLFSKCSVCEGLFNNDESFDEHKKFHDTAATADKVYNCGVCKNEEIFDKKKYYDHVTQHCTDPHQRVYVYTCKYKHCKNYFRSKETYGIHLMKCGKKSENKIENGSAEESSCEEIVEESHKDAIVNCILCNEEFSILEIQNHLRLKQCKGPTKPCKYQNPVVILEETLPNAIENKKKRKKSSPHTKNKKIILSEETEECVPKEPKVFDGTYYCNICDFKENSRETFHDHIITHRDVSTSYQCMECGECFVVKPSLIKHLGFYHQIIDFEEYFDKNNCFNKEAVKELEQHMRGESDEAVGENQCKVCKAQFGDELELSKHFRVHGMAFLKATFK